MKVFSPLLKTMHEVYGRKSYYQKLKFVLLLIKKLLDFTDPTNDKMNTGLTLCSQPTPMQKQVQNLVACMKLCSEGDEEFRASVTDDGRVFKKRRLD